MALIFSVSLPYRANKYNDENIIDYMDRLSFWNGFSSKERFNKYLRNLFDKVYGDNEVEKTGASKPHLMLEQLFKRNIPVINFLSFEGCKIQIGDLRICDKCWAEGKYIRFYWRFSGYITCHVHGNFMIDPSEFSYQIEFVPGSPVDVSSCLIDESSRFLLSEAIVFHLKAENSLSLIEAEVEQHSYMKEIAEWTEAFFKKYLNLHLNLKKVLELLSSGRLIGLPLYAKMEEFFECFIEGNEAYSNAVRVFTVVSIRERSDFWLTKSFYNEPAEGFDRWTWLEVLSTEDLFYAYIACGLRIGRPENYRIENEIVGLGNLDYRIGREITQAIFNDLIIWPYGEDYDLKAYLSDFRNFKVLPKFKRYKEYLISIGKRTIDDFMVE